MQAKIEVWPFNTGYDWEIRLVGSQLLRVTRPDPAFDYTTAASARRAARQFLRKYMPSVKERK